MSEEYDPEEIIKELQLPPGFVNEIDDFRSEMIAKIAKEEHRTVEEMTKIIIDRGLDWWGENVGGCIKELRK